MPVLAANLDGFLDLPLIRETVFVALSGLFASAWFEHRRLLLVCKMIVDNDSN